MFVGLLFLSLAYIAVPASVEAQPNPPRSLVITLPSITDGTASFTLYCANDDGLKVSISLDKAPLDFTDSQSVNLLVGNDNSGFTILRAFAVPEEDTRSKLVIDDDDATHTLIAALENHAFGSVVAIVFGDSSTVLRFTIPSETIGQLSQKYRQRCNE